MRKEQTKKKKTLKRRCIGGTLPKEMVEGEQVDGEGNVVAVGVRGH